MFRLRKLYACSTEGMEEGGTKSCCVPVDQIDFDAPFHPVQIHRTKHPSQS